MQGKDKKNLIAIDGGGTKTIGVLLNVRGKIFKKIKEKASNPNKIGFNKAIFVLKKLIFCLSKNKKIGLAFLGLAGGLERDEEKKRKIQKELQKYFSFPIIVDGDQKIAFRAGSDADEGIVVIAGTGSIAMGWKGKKEEIAGGWDWLLGDQGSAFWIGKKAIEKALKLLDGRENNKTQLLEIILKDFKIKKEKEFYHKFYSVDFVEKIAYISKLVDKAASQDDLVSIEILKEAGEELAEMAATVIKKLNFNKETFPIVLVGGVFKSKFVLQAFKNKVKKIAPNAKFLLPKKKPIFGAVKLAIEKYANFGN